MDYQRALEALEKTLTKDVFLFIGASTLTSYILERSNVNRYATNAIDTLLTVYLTILILN